VILLASARRAAADPARSGGRRRGLPRPRQQMVGDAEGHTKVVEVRVTAPCPTTRRAPGAARWRRASW
jgi:hypothetical protein